MDCNYSETDVTSHVINNNMAPGPSWGGKQAKLPDVEGTLGTGEWADKLKGHTGGHHVSTA